MRITVLDGQEGQDPSHAAPHRTSTARPSPAASDGGGGGGATCTHAPALHSATRTFVTRAQATDLSSAPSRARRTPALARRASLPADSHAYHVGVDMQGRMRPSHGPPAPCTIALACQRRHYHIPDALGSLQPAGLTRIASQRQRCTCGGTPAVAGALSRAWVSRGSGGFGPAAAAT